MKKELYLILGHILSLHKGFSVMINTEDESKIIIMYKGNPFLLSLQEINEQPAHYEEQDFSEYMRGIASRL